MDPEVELTVDEIETWVAEGDTTFYGLRTGSPGTYLLGVSTLPRELGMEGVDFNEYLGQGRTGGGYNMISDALVLVVWVRG